MEYLKTLDDVARKETKILINPKQLAVYNHNDIESHYIPTTTIPLYAYGSSASLPVHYVITGWQKRDAIASFFIDKSQFINIPVQFISEPLIRQFCGAALVAKLLVTSTKQSLDSLPTPHPQLAV